MAVVKSLLGQRYKICINTNRFIAKIGNTCFLICVVNNCSKGFLHYMVVFLRAISLPGDLHIPLVSEMHVREHDNSLILLLSIHGFCLLSQLSEVSSAENVRTPASLLLEGGVRATCVARLGLGRLIEGGWMLC